MKKLLRRNEFYVALVIIVFSIVIQIISGEFFTVGNITDLARSCLTPGLIALAFLMVVISGGLDLSFPAIAALSAYIPLSYMIDHQWKGNPIWAFLIALVLGALMGIPNAFFIGKWHLPPLVVTLGTCQVYRGILMGAFNATTLTKFPSRFTAISKASILTMENKTTGGTATVTPLLFLLVAVVILVWFILHRTRLGRGIFAIGGNLTAAERVGYNSFRINLFLYMFSGAMAALAAVTRFVMLRTVQPSGFDTMDMTILSMVVIGGASLAGGVGTVLGTILGVILITMINNSLILLGVGTYWQQLVNGLIIIIGTSATAYQQYLRLKRPDNVIGRYEAMKRQGKEIEG